MEISCGFRRCCGLRLGRQVNSADHHIQVRCIAVFCRWIGNPDTLQRKAKFALDRSHFYTMLKLGEVMRVSADREVSRQASSKRLGQVIKSICGIRQRISSYAFSLSFYNYFLYARQNKTQASLSNTDAGKSQYLSFV